MTGPQAVSFLSLPYLPESICIETALGHLDSHPDLVVSLGGESFVVYCMSGGSVRRMVSSNRCAAGSGEFLVQQFGRMNLDLMSGIEAARQGRPVALAARCSVHCKSDATHKLNKGECTPADIARSLIASLAARISALIASAGWLHKSVLLVGGLAQSTQLVEELSRLLPETRFEVPPASGYLEALGAAAAARQDGAHPPADAGLGGSGLSGGRWTNENRTDLLNSGRHQPSAAGARNARRVHNSGETLVDVGFVDAGFVSDHGDRYLFRKFP